MSGVQSRIDDFWKKKKQQEEKHETSVQPSSSSVDNRISQFWAQKFTSSLPQRLNTLQESKNQMYKNYNSRFTDGNGNYKNTYRGDTADALSAFNSSRTAYESDSKKFLDELAGYEKYLDAEQVKKIKDALADNSDLDDLYKAYQGDHDYFSQWENEEAYNYSKSQAEKQKKYSAMSDDELEKEIEKVGGKSEGFFDSLAKGVKKGFKSLALNNLEANITNSNTPDSVKGEIIGNIEDERNKTAERDSDLAMLQKEKTSRKIKALDSLPDNVKKLIEEYTALDREKEEGSFKDDATVLVAGLTGAGGGNYDLDSGRSRREEIAKELNSLGVENWSELVEYNRIRRDEDYYKESNNDYVENATAHPFLTSVATIPASATKIMGAKKVFESAVSGSDVPLNYNSPYFTGNNFVNTTRETVMENYDWEGENTNIDWFDQIYSTAMSTGDSLFNMALTGGSKLSGAVLGATAMSDTAQEVARNGGSKEQALLTGIVAGVNEMVWENISIGNFKGMAEKGIKKLVSIKGAKTFVGNILKSVGVNASEEFNNEAANIIVDYLVNGGLSSYAQAYDAYRQGGYTETEARKEARNDMIKQTVMSGVGGAMQGLLMGGAGSALGGALSKSQYNQQAKNMTPEEISALQMRAEELKVDITKYQDEKGNIRDKKLSNLLIAVEDAEAESTKNELVKEAEKYGIDTKQYNLKKDSGVQALASAVVETKNKISTEANQLADSIYQTAIKERLISLGENESYANYIAGGIVRKESGETLDEYRESSLKNKSAQIAYSEFKSVGENAPQWVKDVDARAESAERDLVRSYQRQEMAETTPAVQNKTAPESAPSTPMVDTAPVVSKAAEDFAAQFETPQKQEAARRLYVPALDRNVGFKTAFDAYYNAGLKGIGSFEAIDKYYTYAHSLPLYWRKQVFSAGRENKVYNPGVNAFYQQALSATQKNQIRIMDAIGKEFGISFIVFDRLKDDGAELNGMQLSGTNKILVSLDADGKLYLRTAGHECFHLIEEWNPAEAQKLVEKVIGYLKNTEGYDYSERVTEYAKRYGVDANTADGLKLIHSEMAADSMFDVFSNEKFVKDLVEKNRTLAQKLKDVLQKFLQQLRNMMNSFKDSAEMNALREQTEALEEIRSSFHNALRIASTEMQKNLQNEQKNSAFRKAITEKAGNGTQDGVRKSFQGYAADGKGKYKGNFPKGTPKAAKAEVILKYIQNVWAQNPIRLKITENGESRFIYAEFDPYYDESQNTLTDASKLMGGNRHGTSSEQRVTLDLADDYYQIASEARYNYSKDEIGKDNPAHNDVIRWHYFINDIYFAEYGSDEYVPYRVSINIKERADGDFVYSFSAEKQEKLNTQRTLHAVVNDEKNIANAQLSNTNLPQNENGVNTYFMQDDSNNTKNPKSIKMSSSARETLESNPELKLIFENLQKQMQHSEGYIPNGKRIHKFATELCKNSGTTLSATEVENDLQEIYKVLASIEDSEGYEYAWDLTVELAQKMLDNSTIFDASRTEQKELRGKLNQYFRGKRYYLSPEMRSEIEKYYDTYGAFHRRVFGKGLSFSENTTTTLESEWDNICKELPELFDIDTNVVDQPIAILEAYMATDDRYGLFDEYELDSQVKYTAADIMGALTEIPTSKILFDRIGEKKYISVASLSNDNLTSIEKLKKQYSEEIEEISLQAEARYKMRIKKNMEQKKATEVRRQIEKQIVRLSDMLAHGKKNRHIPLKLIDAVRDLCYAVTLNRASQNTLGENLSIIEASYAALNAGKENADGELNNQFLKNAYDKYVHELVKNLKTVLEHKSVANMTLEELIQVNETVKAVAQRVTRANELHIESRNAGVEETANAIGSELGAPKMKRAYSWDLLNKGSDKAELEAWKFLKPVYAWRMMGSETFAEIMGNIRAGEDTWAVDMYEAKEKIDALAERYNKKTWEKGKIEVELSSGTYSFSIQQLMMLYVASQREQYIPHLLGNPSKESPTGRVGGGFVFEDAYKVEQKIIGKNAGKVKNVKPKMYRERDAGTHTLIEEDLETIAEVLTAEQKGYANEMRDYLARDLAVKGNEITRVLYDMNKFVEEKYFPIKVARNFLDGTTKEPEVRSVLSQSMLKDLQEDASDPVLLRDFDTVWAEHVQQMAMFHSFALPLDDYQRVFNFRTTKGKATSIKTQIETACGKGAISYIENFIKDVNGGVRAQNGAAWANTATSLFKKSAVFASASVTIQQGSAIARAIAEVDPKYFTNPTLTKKDYEELMKYAPIARIKSMGFFDTNIGQSSTDWLTSEQYGKVWDKVKEGDFKGVFENVKAVGKDSSYRDELLSKAPEVMDEITWCNIWHAVKKETAAKTGLTGEDLLKKSGKRFAEVVELTQVYDSVFSKSELMRSRDTGVKMMTAFMAEPTVSLNMLVDAAVQAKRGNLKGGGRYVGAFVASVILNNILKALVTAPRDDDEEKTLIEKYIAKVIGGIQGDMNPLSLIPIVKDAVSIFDGYSIERADMSLVQNLYDAIEDLSSDKKTVTEKGWGVANALSDFLGIPLRNITRDGKAAINLFKGLFTIGDTSAEGIKQAVEDASGDSLWNKYIKKNIFGSSEKQLYEAIRGNDYSAYEKLQKGEYGGDSVKVKTAIRSGLAEYDERVTLAAQARLDKDFYSYDKYVRDIAKDGFSNEDVVKAVNKVYNKLTETEESGEPEEKFYSLYSSEDLNNALETGGDYKTVIEDMIAASKKNGSTQQGAESSVKTKIAGYWKEVYFNASAQERKEIEKLLDDTGLYRDIEETTSGWVCSILKEEYLAATSTAERNRIKQEIWKSGYYSTRKAMNNDLEKLLEGEDEE